MSFDEVRFPTNLSLGSAGGPGYSTLVIETEGGREERIQRWPNARRQWDARYGVKKLQDHSTLLSFYLARGGAKRGFRFQDPFDYCSNSTHPYRPSALNAGDQEIGVGDGTEVDFQLIKTYTNGGQSVVRTITKPQSGTVIAAVNGVTKTEGVDYTVNTATGVITFGTAPPNTHVVTAGFLFDTPVRFGEGADDLLSTTYDDFESGSSAVPIIEVIEDTQVEGDYNWGGHLDVSLTANRTLSVTEARSYAFDAASGSLYVQLPDPTNLPAGGPYFVLHNVGSTHAIDLKDDGGTTLLSIATGTSVMVSLYVEADGTTKGWVAW